MAERDGFSLFIQVLHKINKFDSSDIMLSWARIKFEAMNKLKKKKKKVQRDTVRWWRDRWSNSSVTQRGFPTPADRWQPFHWLETPNTWPNAVHSSSGSSTGLRIESRSGTRSKTWDFKSRQTLYVLIYDKDVLIRYMNLTLLCFCREKER